MRRFRHKSRVGWVKRVLGRNRRFTPGHMRHALLLLGAEGWASAMPPDGPVDEEFALVHCDHPMFEIIRQLPTCDFSIDRSTVERAIGSSLAAEVGAETLAQCGLAVAALRGNHVVLHSANRAAARVINLARIHPSMRGYAARNLIHAFARPKRPGRRRVNLNDDLRMNAAEVLQAWQIDAEDLLDRRGRIRVRSAWTYPEADSHSDPRSGGRR